jgi:hypothetical protein
MFPWTTFPLEYWIEQQRFTISYYDPISIVGQAGINVGLFSDDTRCHITLRLLLGTAEQEVARHKLSRSFQIADDWFISNRVMANAGSNCP